MDGGCELFKRGARHSLRSDAAAVARLAGGVFTNLLSLTN